MTTRISVVIAGNVRMLGRPAAIAASILAPARGAAAIARLSGGPGRGTGARRAAAGWSAGPWVQQDFLVDPEERHGRDQREAQPQPAERHRAARGPLAAGPAHPPGPRRGRPGPGRGRTPEPHGSNVHSPSARATVSSGGPLVHRAGKGVALRHATRRDPAGRLARQAAGGPLGFSSGARRSPAPRPRRRRS